jgi:hypothetical protein
MQLTLFPNSAELASARPRRRRETPRLCVVTVLRPIEVEDGIFPTIPAKVRALKDPALKAARWPASLKADGVLFGHGCQGLACAGLLDGISAALARRVPIRLRGG